MASGDPYYHIPPDLLVTDTVNLTSALTLLTHSYISIRGETPRCLFYFSPEPGEAEEAGLPSRPRQSGEGPPPDIPDLTPMCGQ